MSTQPLPAGRRMRLLLLIVLLFATLGPLTGGVVYMLVISIAHVRQIADLAEVVMAPMLGLLLVPFSFLFGLMPALFVGLIVGLRETFFAPVDWPLVVALGVIAGVALIWVTDAFGTLSDVWHDPEVVIAQMASGVVSSIVCWLALRWRRPAVRTGAA